MAEFETPAFLKNHSPEEVHALMKQTLPAAIDMSEGGHAYNLTFPTALIVAELCEFILPEVIKLIFPETSYGSFTDGHAKAKGMARRPATAASGELTITGTPNTVIPAGSIFSTAAVNDQTSVDYRTLEAVAIPETGTVTVDVECTQTGIIGNTIENTVVLVSSRLSGITAVTNEAPLTGGTEEEDDASLIQRIVEYNKSQGESYVGSVSDYHRWAMSVPGVGAALVIPAEDTSGIVTIIVTDANGDPATEQLCAAVYNYIMRPDAPMERLAPTNALLKVEAPTTMQISIKATVELEDETTLEAVVAAYLARLAAYLPVALSEKEIKYSRIWGELSATEGVHDHTGLQIGLKTGETVSYGTANIAVPSSQLPTIDAADLILTVGTV